MKIITGASWATAEFNEKHELNGPGFGQYISLHDLVVNLATGGLTDDQSLSRLSHFLQNYNFQPSKDTIFWVVNCPPVSVENIVEIQEGLIAFFENKLFATLAHANKIAQKYDTKIQCIGGLCDLVPIQKYSQFSNLDIVVPSWGQLLDPNYHTAWFTPPANQWADLAEILKQQRPDLIEEWFAVADEITKKESSWKSLSSWGFSTDGHHPDRYGHRALRDFLFPEWQHKL